MCEAKRGIIYGMEHTHFIVLAENSWSMSINYIIGGIVVCGLAGIIATVYNIKSNERIKFEEERTKQKTIEAVSEGKLSMDDAEKLLKPEKKPWWKRVS